MSGEAAWARAAQPSAVSASLRDTDLELAARLSRQGLDRTPDDPHLLRLLLLAQLGLRDVAGAQDTADRLEGGAMSPETLDAVISARLSAGRLAQARDIVACAARSGDMPAWALESARARLAMQTDDLPAARAILVRGIEREPEAPWLRSLLAEVMLADGSAADARQVIGRLGQPPSAPGPEAVFDTAGAGDRATGEGPARASGSGTGQSEGR